MLKKIFTTTGNFVLNRKHHCFQIRSLSSIIEKQKEKKKKKTDKKSVSADTGIFTAVDGIVLRSLKDHYLEASKMSPPPKMNPPAPFEIVKGALENRHPGTTAVLRRAYNDGNESIDVSVMRLANFISEADEEEEINQLFLHVDVTKKGCNDATHFLCALYPDAIGIHSVRFGPISLTADNIHDNHSRSFQELDQKLQDAFHMYIEERGINESLFPFLQAWLYVKDHRNLMHWFKSVGSFVNKSN